MAAADKLLIVHWEQGARGGEELWVKNHLAVEKEGSAQGTLISYSLSSLSGLEGKNLV